MSHTPASAPLTLYSFFNSSASFRVRIALGLKALDYQFVYVDIRSGAQSEDAYLGAVSPSPLVPALVHGDVRISQSMAILDYLDQAFPERPLIPADPVARARELEFANIIACDTHPLNNLRILKYLGSEMALDKSIVDQWYQQWIDVGLGAAERILSSQPQRSFCFGDSPSLADCVLIPQIANALRKGCDLSAATRCVQIYENAMQQPVFTVAAPSAQADFVG